MNNTPLYQLTLRLTQALDTNYDVVDMGTVVEVISALEGTPITKEELEATRLAKFINQLRRRTVDETLARRAKNLLKIWREMLGMKQNTANVLISSSNASSSMVGGIANATASTGGLQSSENSISTSFVEKNICNQTAKLCTEADIEQKPPPTPLNFSNLLRGDREVEHSQLPDEKSAATRTDSTVVIDIHDSNSSNLTTATLNYNQTSMASDDILTEAVSWPTTKTPNKTKKYKKDKNKHKDRRSEDAYFDGIMCTVSNQPDATTLKPASALFGADDHSRFGNQYLRQQPNVSEILTLSNCSMSSNFPPDDISLRSSANNYTSELSFAGKFKDTTKNAGTVGSLPSVTTASHSFNTTISKMPTCASGSGGAKTMSSQLGMQNINCRSNDNSSSNSNFSQNDLQNQHNTTQVLMTSEQKPDKERICLPNLSKLNDDLTVAERTARSSETVFSNENKVPKKRGRKKGSKGVDSVISNEASLSSQMLITSLSNGVKKVKTTKELYAEIQNRKNATLEPKPNTLSPSTYLLQKSTTPLKTTKMTTLRSDSPSSETSNYSLLRLSEDTSKTDTLHTVAGIGEIESDNDTLTSTEDATAPRYDYNLMKMRKKKIIKSSSIESNSKTGIVAGTITNNSNALTAIKLELRKLLQRIPTLTIENIELACSMEQILCSCKIRELNAEDQNEQVDRETESKELVAKQIHHSTTTSSTEMSETIVKINQTSALLTQNNKNNANNNENNNLITATAIKTTTADVGKPKKSIFDFDFDADEDPLLKIKEDLVTLTNVKQELDKNLNDNDNNNKLQEIIYNDTKDNIEIQQEMLKNQSNEKNIDIAEQDLITEQQEPAPLFEIIEDENCLAKQKYEIQTQKISNFHIKSLHNYYIANVNGNWDHGTITTTPNIYDFIATGPTIITTASTTTTETKLSNEIETVSSNIVDMDVVPTYGSLVHNNLRKYFYPDIIFTLNYSTNNQRLRQMQRLYAVPFLGIGKHLRRQYVYKNQIRQFAENIDKKKIKLSTQIKQQEQPENVTFIEQAVNKIAVDEMITEKSIEQDDELEEEKTKTFQKEDDKLNTCIITDYKRNSCGQRRKTTRKKKTKRSGQCSSSCCSSSSSSDFSDDCNSNTETNESNTSLKHMQKSINLKLKRQRLLRQQQQQHEKMEKETKTEISDNCINKRKRKSRDDTKFISDNPNASNLHVIKRIKIAINGDIATQRQISYKEGSNINSSMETSEEEQPESNSDHALDDDDDETDIQDQNSLQPYVRADDDNSMADDDDDDYNEQKEDNDSDDFHEVVTRNVSDNPTTGNRHIVLTIKKAPRNRNSSSPLLLPKSETSTKTSSKSKKPSKIRVNKSVNTELEQKPETAITKTENSKNAIEKKLETVKSSPDNSTHIPIKMNYSNSFLEKCDYVRKRLKKRLLLRQKAAYLNQNNNNNNHNINNNCLPTVADINGKTISKKKKHKQLFHRSELYPRLSIILSSIKQNEVTNTSEHVPESFSYWNLKKNKYDKLLNISSCSSSSSCIDSSNDDSDFFDGTDLSTKVSIALNKLTPIDIKTKTTATTLPECKYDNNDDADTHNSDDESTEDENLNYNGTDKIVDESNQLPNVVNSIDDDEKNNELLISFNHIYHNEINESVVKPQIKTSILPTTTSTINPACNNNDNNNDITADNVYDISTNSDIYINNSSRSSINTKNSNYCQQQMVASNQLRIRENKETILKKLPATTATAMTNILKSSSNAESTSVLNNSQIPHTDTGVIGIDGNTCSGYKQRFKEWHQVLQLRSYNDELLTVLPYVVLD